MAVQVSCPSCGAAFKTAEQNLGRNAKCSKCGGRFTLVAATSSQALTAASTQQETDEWDGDIDSLPQPDMGLPALDGSWGSSFVFRTKADDPVDQGDGDHNQADQVAPTASGFRRLLDTDISYLSKYMPLALVLGIGVPMFLYIRDPAPPNAPPIPSPTAAAESKAHSKKIEAWVQGQLIIKEKLPSPSTASFGGLFGQDAESSVKDLGNNRYRVKGWVDSQNGFGATVRADFVITIVDRGGRWELEGDPWLLQR